MPEMIRPGDVVQITVTGSDDGSESGTVGAHCAVAPALWVAPAREGPWTMHAGNYPGTGSSANAPPVTHTYRIPAPQKGTEGRARIVVIDSRFANGFRDGAHRHASFWKDGPAGRRP
ncbi:MAG TPA: hypothetical protein VLH79_08465 [Chthonomonadales bacterium]|nr:hypothetical protein [Chthonomonadales bacterium]